MGEWIKEVAALSCQDVIKKISGAQFDRAGKTCCPLPGHNEKTPSLSIDKKNNKWKCFGCGEGGDCIDFVAKYKGLDNTESAKLLAELFGISTASQRSASGGSASGNREAKPPCNANLGLKTEAKKYIEVCAADIGRTDYFKQRGLNDVIIKRFHLGYDVKKDCVVIPYSSELKYYQTRSISGKEFRKPPTETAGQEPLWNPEALTSDGMVFVVESPICALSIIQCGGHAVSICGATGGQKLINEVKGKKLRCTFILSLDNDDAGQKAQADLANALFDAGGKFITYNIAGEQKDPNELLKADPKALAENIRAAMQSAKRAFSKLQKLFSADELQTREMRPIRWIVHDLLPEGLTLLAAPSKYGKSWMMMQLCVAVTQGKPFLEHKTEMCECVYFSLEDSERRFKGRLNKMTDNKKAPKGFFGSVSSLTMATGLFEQLAELMETYPNIGLIIIDTFQKVRGGQGRNESVYGADYREMGEMKAFADKYGICLLLVHHLRKQDDDSDVFNRINGSMAIMGASDTSWILARKKRGDINTMLSVTGRDIEDAELIISFDKSTVTWNLIGNAEEEAARLARTEYESNAVIKTIKALVEKKPSGWNGNCSEIKLQIYEQTGTLFQGSADTVGRTISKYLDRLSADGIVHVEGRGKQHRFSKKQPTLWDYNRYEDKD